MSRTADERECHIIECISDEEKQEEFMHISYTKQAENAIKYAAKKAREMQHPYIGTEHLLLGLHQEYSGVAGWHRRCASGGGGQKLHRL